MKRSQPQRLTSFLAKPKLRLGVQELETRDVPAVFFVDPSGNMDPANFSGAAIPGATPMNASNTFTTLDAALTAAAKNSTADTIKLAAGTIPVNNVGGTAVFVNDKITLIGSGAGNTTVSPTFDASDVNNDYTLEVDGTANSLNLQDFTYSGTGKQDNGVKYDFGATGTITGVTFTGAGGNAGGVVGNSVWARNGSKVAITGSTFNDTESDLGVYASSTVAGMPSVVSVDTSTFNGPGALADRSTFAVSAVANSKLTVTGSTFNGYSTTGSSPNGNTGGTGISLIGAAGFSPNGAVIRNTFTNNQTGLLVGSGAAGDKSSAQITYNSFSGDTLLAIQSNGAPGGPNVINARFNYFGSAAGPTGTNGVSPAVNASQFLRAPLGSAPVNQPTFVTGAAAAPSGSGSLAPVSVYNYNNTSPPTATKTGQQYTPPDAASEARVAYRDLTGDGVRDIVIGSGTTDTVQVINGATGAVIDTFFALGAGKATPIAASTSTGAGGVFVAIGDINADGKYDVVVSEGSTDPRVIVFNGVSVLAGAANPTKIRDFFDASGRTGAFGVSVAAGDFNGDGYDDIVTGIDRNGFGAGNASVRIYDGKTLATSATVTTTRANPPTPNVDIAAYEYAIGTTVAAGDVNGDGRADLITGTLSLGANIRVFTFNTASTTATGTATFTPVPTQSVLVPVNTQNQKLAASFLVGNQNDTVRVAARDFNNDGYAEILYSVGANLNQKVGVVDGASLSSAITFGTNGQFNNANTAGPPQSSLLVSGFAKYVA